jgi:hypothetical protein
MTSSPIVLAPRGSTRARLRVEATPSRAFTVTAAGDAHRIGFPDAPIAELMQPPSPDDALEIDFLPGQFIEPTGAALDIAEACWVPPRARRDLAAIVRHLPAGDYWLVRCSNQVGEPGVVLLGNEIVTVDRSLRELHESERYYVLAVGTTAGLDPDLGRPLLGVTILNYTGTGQETTQGVWLLSPFAPREEGTPAAVEEGDDTLAIIPVTGPLVLDHLERLSSEDSARCRDRWARGGARDLVEELALR